MIEVVPFLSAAKHTLDMLVLAVEARDFAKIDGATSDLREKYANLTMKITELATANYECEATVRDLKTQINDLQEEAKEKLKFEIFEVVSGGFCYKRIDGGVEPVYYLCQPCYDKGVRSILRDKRPTGGFGLECIENKSHFIWVPESGR